MAEYIEREASERLSEFLSFLRESEDNLRMAIEEMEQTGAETQDILHRLELYDDKHHAVAALGKKMRTVRRRRRVAKDTVELLTPLVEWAGENKDFLSGLQRVLGELRKIERRQQNRTYLPRTDILEDGCGARTVTDNG